MDLHLIFFIFRTLCVVFILPALVFVLIYTSWNFDYWKKRRVPYVTPLPFFGNLQFILSKSFYEFFDETYRRFKGDYYGIFLGRVPALVIQSNEMAKRVILKHFDCFQDRSLYSGHSDPLGSMNLFTLNNPTWSAIRRHITPIFTTAKLRMLYDVMNENSTELVKKIKRDHVEGSEPVDLKLLFTLYTSDTIGSTVFGLRAQVLRDSNSPLWLLTQHMVKWEWKRGLEFITIFFVPSLAETFKLKFFSEGATQHVRQMFWSVVNSRRAAHTIGQHRDLVDTLLKMQKNANDSGEEMSDDMLLAQAALFILGGVETSSTTLSYCLYQLAHNPDIQERLYKEIKTADEANQNKPLSYTEIQSMRFLRMCIHETLRLYPPVPYIDRRCSKRYRLDENLVIDEGTPVFINVVGLHHDEKFFKEPLKWDPERFSEDKEREMDAFTFLPFGDGPRFCMGKRYGMMQVSAAVVHIVREFNVMPKPGFPLPAEMLSDPKSVILSPKLGIQVKFVPRDVK